MYRRCGFDVDPSASTLQMLTNIEMRLEDYLKQVCMLVLEYSLSIVAEIAYKIWNQ